MPSGVMQTTQQTGVDFLHQAGGNGTTGPTLEDQKFSQQIWRMLFDAKKYRQNWDVHWNKYWKLWEGVHWQRAKFSMAQATVNLVHRAVETFLGNITDNIPAPKPRATNPAFTNAARLAEQELKYIWRHNNGVFTIRRPIRSALTVGTGWCRVDWDETDLSGQGDVRFWPKDARSIWVSPHSEDPWLSDALYVIEARNVPRDWVVRKWEKGADVPPGVWDGTLNQIRSHFSGSQSHGLPFDDVLSYVQTTDGAQTQGTFAQASTQDKRNLMTLIEAWIRQEDGTLRYTVVANGVVLEDGPSPYDDDKYPYVPFFGIKADDGWYARGIVQFVEGLQYEMNELHSYSLDIIHYLADPILVMDEENLELGHKIDNVPGAIFPKIRGSDIGYVNSPGLRPEMITMQEQVKSYFDEVLGNVDILSGIRPTGVNTLGGLEVLRDQANVRLRMMIENLRQSLKLLYELCLSRFRQFVKDERVIRIAGDEFTSGAAQEEYVALNQVVGMSLTGEPERENTIPADAEFEMEFDTAPGGPAGRQARKDEALALYQAGVIDQQAVLKDFEREDAEEILQRGAEAAKAAQAAQGDPATAGGGSPPAGTVPESENPVADAMSYLTEVQG